MLVPHALGLNLLELLMNILEAADLSKVVDASTTKVNAIAILKLIIADRQHGQRATMMLEKDPRWERYKYQRHDLFVTKNEKIDYFLADSTNSGQKMLRPQGNRLSQRQAARARRPRWEEQKRQRSRRLPRCRCRCPRRRLEAPRPPCLRIRTQRHAQTRCQ